MSVQNGLNPCRSACVLWLVLWRPHPFPANAESLGRHAGANLGTQPLLSFTTRLTQTHVSFVHSFPRPPRCRGHGLILCACPTTSAMATAAIDAAYIAASYDFPVSSLVSLLDAPAVELVQSLLIQIEAKAREHEELRAEKLRSDIDLENAVRTSQAQRTALKASHDTALKELEELRRKLNNEGIDMKILILFENLITVSFNRESARFTRIRTPHSKVQYLYIYSRSPGFTASDLNTRGIKS